MKKDIVIKVGGSILYDHLLNINFDLFKKVKEWYELNKKEYDHIVLVVGGGGLSRNMETKVSESIKDPNGIHNIAMSVTQTNATILASYLEDKEIFVPQTLGDAYEFLHTEKKGYMVSGGLKVGWSTDMDAAVFADALLLDRVFKVSDIDYIYDKDPKEYFEAKPIRDMTWKEYFKMFSIMPNESHTPNSHMPVDAKCSIFCNKKNIAFNVSGGKLLYEKYTLSSVMKKGTFLHS